MKAVKARTRKLTHKYGIEVPRTVEQAHKLDAKNGDDYWRKAIAKEMRNVGVAFDVISPPRAVPPGWTKVRWIRLELRRCLLILQSQEG